MRKASSTSTELPELVPILSRGKHRNPRKGACFMEMASFLAGERWSDHPRCTHPLLASVARLTNDLTSDAERWRLAELIPSVIGLTTDDPRADARIALRCATTALPIANRDELQSAVEEAGGMELEVLSGEEEARLSFVGATRTLLTPTEGTIAVIDVGGGSSEIAIGEPDGEMAWSASFRIGSGFLADAYLRSDPPSVDELEKVRRHVAGTFEGLEPPPADSAVAVGGTATSLRRLLGAELVHETLERGIRVLSTNAHPRTWPRRFELEPRARPAAARGDPRCSEAFSDLLALPLRIARGGLREGALLELVEGRSLA